MRNWKKLAGVAMVLALSAGGAAGADLLTLGRSGSDSIFVWKDSDAHSEAIRLIDAGVHKTNPVLVMQLMSCIADPGDHAVLTDGGFFSSTVLLTDGDNAGCRGVIANEDIRK